MSAKGDVFSDEEPKGNNNRSRRSLLGKVDVLDSWNRRTIMV